MIFFLTSLLAGASVLPQIDRHALELQSRAEALQPRAHVARPVSKPVVRVAARTAPRPEIRRAAVGNPMNLSQITTICRAAGSQGDPATFLATLSSAYSLSNDDSVALRSSCAAYLAGRADARRVNY
jgi:hypothetical protein